MRLLLGSLGIVAHLFVATEAHAQENSNCARNLMVAELNEAEAESAALSREFREAFAAMTLDKATGTVSTVGATLLGSSLANEVAAVAEGLRHMVTLRDETPALAREAVVGRLMLHLKDAGRRVRHVSMSYGQVARMANLPEVQGLAANAMQFTDTLSKRWSCQ